MGVDFSHGDACWAYSGFHRFRVLLAKEIGIELEEMAGFGGKQRSWKSIKDPIVKLLNHSDCDGELTSDECREVAPRIRELVANWNEDDIDRVQALMLADGMDEAAASGEPFEFV